jgi:hypothetical protein
MLHRMKNLRAKSEFPIIEFLRTRPDATHSDDVERHVSQAFNLNRLNPAVKETIRVEVSFALSRLNQLHLVRLDSRFVRLTDEGYLVTKDRLDAMDVELVRKQREARK